MFGWIGVLEGAGPEVVAKSVLKFANYGKSNKESVAELFVTLLIKVVLASLLPLDYGTSFLTF